MGLNPQTTVIFNTTDTELLRYSGKEVQIVEVIEKPDATHDEEVLPMYILNVFHNGKNVEAFASEIEKVPYEKEEVLFVEEDLQDTDASLKEELDEVISEMISNKTGFSHFGFSYKIVVEAKLDKSD